MSSYKSTDPFSEKKVPIKLFFISDIVKRVMPVRDNGERIQALIKENRKQDKRISDLEKELKTVLKSHKDAILTVNTTNKQIIEEIKKLAIETKKIWNAIGTRDMMNV